MRRVDLSGRCPDNCIDAREEDSNGSSSLKNRED